MRVENIDRLSLKASADCIDKLGRSLIAGLLALAATQGKTLQALLLGALTLIGLGENTDKSEDMILRLQMGFLACFLLPF